MAKPIIAWSYSAINTFENCPRKFWATKIKKLVSDANRFNMQGDAEHKDFEYFLSKGLALPERTRHFQPMLERIRDAPGQLYVEYKMTLTQQFETTRYNDWDRAWVRGAADVVKVNGTLASYFDWKSGKVRPSDDQIELSALLLFRHFPEVTQVNGGLVFYRHNEVYPHIVHRDDAPRIWNGWIARVRELEAAVTNENWPATPNPLCAYCPYFACPHNTNPAQAKK